MREIFQMGMMIILLIPCCVTDMKDRRGSNYLAVNKYRGGNYSRCMLESRVGYYTVGLGTRHVFICSKFSYQRWDRQRRCLSILVSGQHSGILGKPDGIICVFGIGLFLWGVSIKNQKERKKVQNSFCSVYCWWICYFTIEFSIPLENDLLKL